MLDASFLAGFGIVLLLAGCAAPAAPELAGGCLLCDTIPVTGSEALVVTRAYYSNAAYCDSLYALYPHNVTRTGP